MSAEYQRTERNYESRLAKNEEDNRVNLRDFVNRTWGDILRQSPALKLHEREQRLHWLPVFYDSKEYRDEQERQDKLRQTLIQDRLTDLGLQHLYDVRNNRIAENLKYTNDALPLGGDWITFLNSPKEKVEVPWIQNGALKFATYYKTTCWFGKLTLRPTNPPQNLAKAAIDTDAPVYYQREQQFKNWQALDLLSRDMASFNSQGETDIFIASEFVEEAYAEGTHIWSLHAYHLKNRSLRKDKWSGKFAMLRLQDDVMYGQDKPDPNTTHRWLVYHPFARARDFYQHNFQPTLKKESGLATAEAAETAKIGSALGPWGPALEAAGSGVGKLIKILSKTVGDRLHKFDPVKDNDSPLWGYKESPQPLTVPNPVLKQEYTPDAGKPPSKEEAVVKAIEVYQSDIALEKSIIKLTSILTNEDIEKNLEIAGEVLKLVDDIQMSREEPQEPGKPENIGRTVLEPRTKTLLDQLGNGVRNGRKLQHVKNAGENPVTQKKATAPAEGGNAGELNKQIKARTMVTQQLRQNGQINIDNAFEAGRQEEKEKEAKLKKEKDEKQKMGTSK